MDSGSCSRRKQEKKTVGIVHLKGTGSYCVPFDFNLENGETMRVFSYFACNYGVDGLDERGCRRCLAVSSLLFSSVCSSRFLPSETLALAVAATDLILARVTKKHFKDLVHVRISGENSSSEQLVVYTDTENDKALLLTEVKNEYHGEAKQKIKAAIGLSNS
ncbi:hypothetical protein LINPERHAP1_LOCUS27300 [Linum perenne]